MARANPVIAAYNQGKREGRSELRLEVLTHLEKKYLAPEIERKTPEADAILTLAKELAELMA